MTKEEPKQAVVLQPKFSAPTGSAFLSRHRGGGLRIQASIRNMFVGHDSLSPGEIAWRSRYEIDTIQAIAALKALWKCGFCRRIEGRGAGSVWITEEIYKSRSSMAEQAPYKGQVDGSIPSATTTICANRREDGKRDDSSRRRTSPSQNATPAGSGATAEETAMFRVPLWTEKGWNSITRVI